MVAWFQCKISKRERKLMNLQTWPTLVSLGLLKTSSKWRAVVDTGIDYNHPNIEPYLSKNTTNEGMGLDILGKDFYPYLSVINPEDLKPVKFPEDYLSHGTHVAGSLGRLIWKE